MTINDNDTAARRAAERIIGPFSFTVGNNPSEEWIALERSAWEGRVRAAEVAIREAIAEETAGLRAEQNAPIDEAWLREKGFEYDEDRKGWTLKLHTDDPENCAFLGGPLAYNLFVRVDKQTACLVNTADHVQVQQAVVAKAMRTRGDLAGLLAALGQIEGERNNDS